MIPHSPNFQFLYEFNNTLFKQALCAERYCLDDPCTSLIKARAFGELLAKTIAARLGVYNEGKTEFLQVINELQNRDIIDLKVADMFHRLRTIGNKAVHEDKGTVSDALSNLHIVFNLAVYFYKIFKDKSFTPSTFSLPKKSQNLDKVAANALDEMQKQIAQLQSELKKAKGIAQQELELRQKAEQDAQKAWAEMDNAFKLATETEDNYKKEIAEYEKQLIELQTKQQNSSDNVIDTILPIAKQCSSAMHLTEKETRQIIDQNLRDAGWEVDSENIRFAKGIRPEAHKNKAIAEWPTESGSADYVLFTGLTPVAIIEAKKKTKNVASALDQAKRYSEGFLEKDSCKCHEVFGNYRVPFVFSTNGRSFLRQLKEESGIWFCDLRRPNNLRRPLESWYTPEGLKNLLKIDIDKAEKKLDEIGFSFGFPLRDYQRKAIEKTEDAIKLGRQAILLAMATGTGKTKTCIAMIYRLLKAQRFSRILFLVDRSALGEQAGNAFNDTEMTGLQKFTDIFQIKEIDEATPDNNTAVHISTVQGMVKRILYASDPATKPKVDQYDCIVVDECHRGYLLDKELSDAELTFRDYDDYISKYRRILDYFDAVKIGLTATPALHTVDIFGRPVFQYSYREAVVDGFLVDHDPPIRIMTELSVKGIHWKPGDTVKMYRKQESQIELFQTPDQIDFKVAAFNKKVITEPFNRVVCEYLASHISPDSKEKTLIFCATDTHADMVVRLLKDAFVAQYGSIEDNAVMKITGAADKPRELIRRYKNERLPQIAVTVDLLTTGIDVPEICNLVFIRTVNSRILYDQMLGRATRLCPEIGKESFKIYDAVDIYSNMQQFTDMKPVVTKPNISFQQLVKETCELTDEISLKEVHEQFIAKLHRKKNSFTDDQIQKIETISGLNLEDFLKHIQSLSFVGFKGWVVAHKLIGEILDKHEGESDYGIPISETPDSFKEEKYGFGKTEKPQDYIAEFKQFINDHSNDIAALKLLIQKPRDLKHKDLRELQLLFDQNGYTEKNLQTAYAKMTNQKIAANILGLIRQAALGDALISYSERVDNALNKIIASRPWTSDQKTWLQRIGLQLQKEIIVDEEAMETAQFRDHGGFDRINKIFNGELAEIMGNITDLIWGHAA